jgi:hypothetical protein
MTLLKPKASVLALALALAGGGVFPCHAQEPAPPRVRIHLEGDPKPGAKPGEAGWELVQPAPVVFSPDGKHLVVGGPKIRCYDAATGKLLWESEGPAPAVAFPDGKRVIDRDVVPGKEIKRPGGPGLVVPGLPGPGVAVRVLPDGKVEVGSPKGLPGELGRHPLLVMFRRHGSRGWEDSLL